LLADVGGTNARFALARPGAGELDHSVSYAVSDFPDLYGALRRYLAEVAERQAIASMPVAACLAVACPVRGDRLRFTNNHWTVERSRVGDMLGGAEVALINDFAAVGHAVTGLGVGDWRQFGGGEPESGRPIAVLGPGTGLGACSLIPVRGGYVVVEGEGGHADFAPVDPTEIAVLQLLSTRFGRVSIERVLSGGGLVNVYHALAQLEGVAPVHKSPAAITAAAQAAADPVAQRTLGLFCSVLGSVAGNMALHLGAQGGVYIAGGIAPRILPLLEGGEFRRRFEAKGRYRDYLAPVPLRVVLKENLGLLGAMRYLDREEW